MSEFVYALERDGGVIATYDDAWDAEEHYESLSSVENVTYVRYSVSDSGIDKGDV